MIDPIAIKQIQIGEEKHDISAKYWGDHDSSVFNDLATQDYVNKKIWYGKESEYNKAFEEGKIGIGTLVIILDEDEGNTGGSGGNPGGDNTGSSTTAKLGTAVLGQMKLGQN